MIVPRFSEWFWGQGLKLTSGNLGQADSSCDVKGYKLGSKTKNVSGKGFGRTAGDGLFRTMFHNPNKSVDQKKTNSFSNTYIINVKSPNLEPQPQGNSYGERESL